MNKITWIGLTVSIRRIVTSINSVHVEWCLSKEIIMAGGPQGLETPGSPQQTPQSPTIQGSPIQLILDNLASLFQSKFPILSKGHLVKGVKDVNDWLGFNSGIYHRVSLEACKD